MQRQIDLEIDMAGIGRDRYLSKTKKDIDKDRGYDTPTGRCVLEASVIPFSTAITTFIAEVYSGRPGPRHTAARLIKDMNPDVVAYLAARAVLGRMMKPRSVALL